MRPPAHGAQIMIIHVAKLRRIVVSISFRECASGPQKANELNRFQILGRLFFKGPTADEDGDRNPPSTQHLQGSRAPSSPSGREPVALHER